MSPRDRNTYSTESRFSEAPTSRGRWEWRPLSLKIVLLLLFATIATRLVQIQVVDSSKYREIARRQYEARVVLPAARGNIYDRNGKILVSNTTQVSFGADPKIVGLNAPTIARMFAHTFGGGYEEYYGKLTAPAKRFVWLERRVDPQFAKRLNVGQLEGVIVMTEPKRIAHYGRLAGQLIGFTDIDNNGLSGVELEHNHELQGTNGFVIMQRDGLGRRRPSVDYPRVEPVNGLHAVLTIDLELQAIAEEELRAGIERNKATSGLVIMVEPSTGEVLAMAHHPGIDPNKVAGLDPAATRNRAITDMFEPGSVFKIVTASAGLEDRIIAVEEKFFAEHGTYRVVFRDGRTRTISDTHEHGVITFQEAMEVSSNIVMAKVSDRIGAERLFTMARNFGFGIATGLGLPGEISGDLKKPNRWSGTTLNSLAFGYEVGVTPIQLALAYAAVANNGVLMKPSILKEIRDENGECVRLVRAQPIRRVISPETARALTHMLQSVVEKGTGIAARLEGISIAGKTGTSRKFVEGRYETGSYTASFAGFFPAEDPQVVCLVMLDNPKVGGYTGGLASAPIFRAIAAKVIATSPRFSRRPDGRIVSREPAVVPDVRNMRREAARRILAASGLEAEAVGDGKTVLEQDPKPGTRIGKRDRVTLVTTESTASVPQGFTRVPDVRGLTIRRALSRLSMAQLDCQVSGSGVVRSQLPGPGTIVKSGHRVELQCTPRSIAAAVPY